MTALAKILLCGLFFKLSTTSTESTVVQIYCPKSCYCNSEMKRVSCNRATMTTDPKIPRDTRYLHISNVPFQPSYLHGLRDLKRLYLDNASITNISQHDFQGKITTYYSKKISLEIVISKMKNSTGSAGQWSLIPILQREYTS